MQVHVIDGNVELIYSLKKGFINIQLYVINFTRLWDRLIVVMSREEEGGSKENEVVDQRK